MLNFFSLISKSDSLPWKEIVELRTELNDKYSEYWKNYDVFSLSWWIMIVSFFLLWFLWWNRVDKSRLHEIVTFGVMVALVASVIDTIGCENVLWGYPSDIDPLLTPLTLTDYCLIPISYMLLYQYFVRWKSFIIASIILSALYVFVAEPIAVWLDIFQLNDWKHLYDFPLYIILALSLKLVMNQIKNIQQKARDGMK